MTKYELTITKEQFREGKFCEKLAVLLEDPALILAFQALKNNAASAAAMTSPKISAEVRHNIQLVAQGVVQTISDLDMLAQPISKEETPSKETHVRVMDEWVPREALGELGPDLEAPVIPHFS